jgi:hypothetical protein
MDSKKSQLIKEQSFEEYKWELEEAKQYYETEAIRFNLDIKKKLEEGLRPEIPPPLKEDSDY